MTEARTRLTMRALEGAFPTNAKIRGPRPIQQDVMQAIADGAVIIEAPTGTGKTALEFAVATLLKEKAAKGESVFVIFPTKALVEQACREHPDMIGVLGQNDHICPWALSQFTDDEAALATDMNLPILYDADTPRVNDIPHDMHRECPHYVDQDTGQTGTPGAMPCPYYQQTFAAKRSGRVIACTMSFYIYAALFNKERYGGIAGLVIDEAHRLADVIRYTLSYEVTDANIGRAIELLRRIEAPEREPLERFLAAICDIARGMGKVPGTEHLLTEAETRNIIAILEEIDPKAIDPKRIKQAIKDGKLSRKDDWQAIKALEILARNLRRYLHTFEFALPVTDDEGEVIRPALNYSCSFCKVEMGERDQVQHKLVIHCHHVAALVRKRLAPANTYSFSATIGRGDMFSFETGLDGTVFSAPSTFPASNRRIFMPLDAGDLSHAADSQGKKKNRALRAMAKGCARLKGAGIRSLVIVVSNEERRKFARFAEELGLEVVTYGGDVQAKDAVDVFKGGNGDVLCGCIAHYGMGIDLPKGQAGAIWFLRPGFPNPESAATKFELERYSQGTYWARIAYRIMLEAEQAIGRNIRGPRDKGVCFLMSSGFQKFVHAALPEWLEPSYRRGKTLSECLEDAEELLAESALV